MEDLSDSPKVEARKPPGLARNRDFLLLFLAQVISLLGSGVTTVGLALFTYKLTGGKDATAVVGNALMLRILAFLIFSQPAGVIADRTSRKRLLILMDLGRFGLLLLFPFVTQVWQVYVLIFLVNALTACFTPTYEATIPQIVGAAHYTQALSLSRVAVDVEAVLGPMLAGILVSMFDIRWVFWVDGLSYLLSAVLILGVTIPPLTKCGLQTPVSFIRDVFHGTRVLLREPSLRHALTASFAEATAGAAAIVATVAYVRDTLGQSDFMVAAAMMAVGVGSAATALLTSRLTARWERGASGPADLHERRHRWAGRMVLTGCLILTFVLLPAALRPPWWIFALLWLFNGVGQALIAIPSSMLVAEHTFDHERGRAYAAHFALTHVCWLITYPAIGYAAAAWGAPMTLFYAGVGCLLITALAEIAGRGPTVPHTHEPTEATD